MKLKAIHKACILLMLSFLSIALTYDTSHRVVFTSEGVDLFNTKHIRIHNNTPAYTVAPINYRDTVNPLITDLLLSFDENFPYLVRDDTGHYSVRYAQFMFSKDAVVGQGCAQFFHNDHRVEIQTAKNTWLTNCNDLGSFTIEANIKLTRYNANGIVISRVGYTGGKQGFEIVCNHNVLAVRFYKMFYKKDNTPVDVFLQKGYPLALHTWYYFAVSFDRISGRLELIINDTVVETVYCTEHGEPFVNVMVPRFICYDIPVVVVGKNFYGFLDNLRISQRSINELEKETEIAKTKFKTAKYYQRTITNREGIITSPVYTFPEYGTMVTLFRWDEQLPPSTFVWMEFRISDELFRAGDPLPRWYRISNNQQNIYLHKVGNEYLRGKYYQWRAHLIPSPDGAQAPIIYNITMEYVLDTAPQPPIMVQLDSVQDTAVTIKWKKNVEHDLLGYKVYYGVQSKKYDGVITTVNGNRITNDMSDAQHFVKVTITNDIIEENKKNDTKGFLTYPLLQNNVLYFFAVTAYDSYKPDTIFNHESRHSQEITARPHPGSDIK